MPLVWGYGLSYLKRTGTWLSLVKNLMIPRGSILLLWCRSKSRSWPSIWV